MSKFYTKNTVPQDAENLRYFYELVRYSLPLPPAGVLLVLAHQWATDHFGGKSDQPIEEIVSQWYNQTMVNYPKAREELNKKLPDPYEYAWGLSAAFSRNGYSYSMPLNYPGGAWRFGRTLAQYVSAAARTLRDAHGFTFQEELFNVPMMGYQDIYEAMTGTGASPDELQSYITEIKNVHDVKITEATP